MPSQDPNPSISISRDGFIKGMSTGLATPVAIEIPYAPAAAYYPAFKGRGTLMFESVKGPFRIARYSFLAFDPYLEYMAKDREHALISSAGTEHPQEHPVTTIRTLVNSYKQRPDPTLPPFQGGAAGLISYDFLHYLERVPTTTDDDLKVPDIHFFLFDMLLAFDHKDEKAWAIVCPGARGNNNAPGMLYNEALSKLKSISLRAEAVPVSAQETSPSHATINHDVSQDQYERMVTRAKEYISAGDIFQANLSLRLSSDIGNRDPWDLYLALRRINPSPFAGYMDFGDYIIAGSSPERLVMVRDGKAELRPIAGTRPRGKDRAEDEQMRSELLLNPKERAEHIMLIDLERNDIGRVCDYGSVEVDELMVTEDYSHVIHIVSNVRGILAPGRDGLDAIKATFPGGTITGVPKVRCMEIIDELESLRRGPYTGSMGYVGFGGSMDMNIIIRTFTIRDNVAYVQAGAGIVADSDPSREYMESLSKAEALIKTLTGN
ncbi:MAG: anthranilate synthase component I family protein [Thermodesulfovibrionales bacterium]|nr:anthranilate synthase component I family protein [Thermodesulfovibrionales bacterium]